MQLVFSRRYSSAHRFLNCDSPRCMVPHGHNWLVTITVSASQPRVLDADRNMVLEFKRAKHDWHQWVDDHMDHTFQVNSKDKLIDWFRAHEPERLSRVLMCPGDPTTEVLAALWQSKAQAFMDSAQSGLLVEDVLLEETPTNSVMLKGVRAFERHLPISAEGRFWWERADASIHDFRV